ncbi:type II secretion system F family protein [Acidobacteria bacterium AH-259-O06]|nr:type II secretion system F family protein [Acidobacteria bacterium AH-259-O06]
MPTYQFRGRRYDTGAVISGTRAAQSRQNLVAALRSERIMPISISEKKAKAAGRGRKVGAGDLAVFTKQFSVMLEAGMPLVQALGILAEQQDNPALAATLQEVKEDVEGGSTLAEAMRKHPKVFDTLFVNMISAGEAGGILDVILRRLSLFVEKIVKLKRSLVSASVYPAIVITVAIGIVVAIMVFVIPTFAELFKNMNAALPLPTRIVMGISDFLAGYILPIMAVLAVSVVLGQRYYTTEGGRVRIDGMILKIPVFGAVIQKIIVARFSRTLGTLLTSGISILEALDITAHTAGNVVIQNALLEAKREVQEGKTLVEPIKRANLFPPMVVQMVGVGEQTGELDQMLQKLADFYEEEADAAIADFLTLIEPLMIVFLGGVIGGIVISMYLPIFSLIGKLAGGG